LCLEPTITDGSGDYDGSEIVDTENDRYDSDDRKPPRPVGKSMQTFVA